MDDVATAVLPQSDWTRTLLTPLRAPAWRACLYFLLISILAVAGVAFIFAAGLASGLLMVTLVGIPLLALVVMGGRAWNRLYRSLARLVSVTLDAPPPFVRPAGRLQTLAAALVSATSRLRWRDVVMVSFRRRTPWER
jgi:hypothetical protein